MKKKNTLKIKDLIRVISPSDVLKRKSTLIEIAEKQVREYLGLIIDYGKNARKNSTSSVEDRVSDLHQAFLDKKVAAILCSKGGFNSNEVLKNIDWNIIRKNPKPFIGSSDITVLLNSIYARTGIITYYGPNFFRFGMKYGLKYTIDYFKKCFFSNADYEILPSKEWSSDKWQKDQENRHFYKNKGYEVIQSGSAEGIIIGGNLCSLNLLQGSVFMPSLENKILFLEDDLLGDKSFEEFNRNLQSLLCLPSAESIKGVVVGRFPVDSEMTLEKIKHMFNSKKELNNIPVIANVDFGHTDPSCFFPIGGVARISAKNKNISIKIKNGYIKI